MSIYHVYNHIPSYGLTFIGVTVKCERLKHDVSAICSKKEIEQINEKERERECLRVSHQLK